MNEFIQRLKSLIGEKSWHRYKRVYALSMIASLLETLSIAAIFPLVNFIGKGEVPFKLSVIPLTPETLIAGILSIYIFGLCLRAVSVYCTSRVNMQEGYGFSARIFELYLKQPYDWHFSNHTADIKAAILNDAQDFISFVMVPLGRFISQTTLVFFVGLVLVFIQPLATFFFCAILGLSYLLIFRILKVFLKSDSEKQIQAHAERHRYSSEALAANREIKLSGLENIFSQKFMNASLKLAKASSQRSLYTEMPKLVLEAFIFILLIVTLFYISSRNEGQLATITPTLTLFAAAGLKLFPMGHLMFANFANLRSGLPLIDKFEALMSQFTVSEAIEVAPILANELRVEDVSYTYPGNTVQVLNHVSFSAKLGDRVAIVGPTGSGKSTLIDIIAGLIQPCSGCVSVDDHPLSATNSISWQKQLQYCPQNPVLFDQTVTQNIALSDDGNISEVKAAASLACVDDLLGTYLDQLSVGETGKKLSGGQVQRISIARAMYNDVSLYILDEPTGNLDAKTADRIIGNIFAAKSSAIIIIVTHDLKLAEKCDIQINLENNSNK